MAGGVAWKKTLVQADASDDSHEKRHRGAIVPAARRHLILAPIDVFHHDPPCLRIDVIAVDARDVIAVFLDDLEVAGGGPITFASCRKGRNTDELTAFVEVGALLAEIDPNGWRTRDTVAVPIRNVVMRSATRRT